MENITAKQKLDFYKYLENETEIYKLNFLGYPWYYLLRDAITNHLARNYIKNKPPTIDAQETRAQDFQARKNLLAEKYDYVFLVKSKMRRYQPTQIENHLFLDIFEYLEQQQKRFLILEMPEKDIAVDKKYIYSKYARYTLPYEFIVPTFSASVSGVYQNLTVQFERTLTEIFSKLNCPETLLPLMSLTQKLFVNLWQNIPQLLILQSLFKQMQIKAFFGGMGSHFLSGINNDYAVVEVCHGIKGFFPEEMHVSEQVRKHDKENFKLDRYYNLFLSTTNTKPYDRLCLTENIYNYGMPELRHYNPNPEEITTFKQKYNLSTQKIVLISTMAKTNNAAVKKLIDTLSNKYPELVIIVRPHPNYDSIENHAEYKERVIPASEISMYGLLSIVDVVLSCPSTVTYEALAFTDHVIIFPNSHQDEDYIRQRYPDMQIYPLNAEELIDRIAEMLSSPSKKIPTKENLHLNSLNNLFQCIENINY